jgi:hypothetical protein
MTSSSPLERLAGQIVSHTATGALTTFTIDTDAARDSWCSGILDTVAGHHDRYSHSLGYPALGIYEAAPSASSRQPFARAVSRFRQSGFARILPRVQVDEIFRHESSRQMRRHRRLLRHPASN